MQEMEEILEFVKFDPGPLCKKTYDDHAGFHKLLNAQHESVTAQGGGSGAKYDPLDLQFNMGPVDAKTFVDMCRTNKKTAVKGLQYSSCYVFEGERKKQADVKYETLTIQKADSFPQPGSRDRLVVLRVGWVKAKGTIKQYDDEGQIEGSLPVDIDLSKGRYAQI